MWSELTLTTAGLFASAAGKAYGAIFRARGSTCVVSRLLEAAPVPHVHLGWLGGGGVRYEGI